MPRLPKSSSIESDEPISVPTDEVIDKNDEFLDLTSRFVKVRIVSGVLIPNKYDDAFLSDHLFIWTDFLTGKEVVIPRESAAFLGDSCERVI